FVLAEPAEDFAERAADRLDRAEAGWLGAERLDDERVVVVGEDEVLFGGEVAEAGGRHDLGRLGDLLDRGGLVALLAEQPQGLVLDGGPGLGLLAFPEAGGRLVLTRQLAYPLAVPLPPRPVAGGGRAGRATRVPGRPGRTPPIRPARHRSRGRRGPGPR